MKNAKPRKTNLVRNSIIAVIAVVIIGIVGAVVYGATRTYPLGDESKLQYIGKVDYGCWLICDSNPGADYFYATNMSVGETVSYFKKANLSQGPRTLDDISDFTLKDRNGDAIAIYYYIDKNRASGDGFTGRTDRSAIVSIPSFEYLTAKNSL